MSHSRAVSKRALALKAKAYTTDGFIQSRIYPLIRGATDTTASSCIASIVRNTGTGRLTIRYGFSHGPLVFAKLYSDELGLHSFRAHQSLWNGGFGDASRHRVPRPLAYLSEHSLLLMLSVEGEPLGTALHAATSHDLASGCRNAAEWLATLHGCPHGTRDEKHSLANLVQQCASHTLLKSPPHRLDTTDAVKDLADTLKARTARLAHHRSTSLVHGRYHLDHVYIGPNATSVIDLDRCRFADPAIDVAEFIRMMRLRAFSDRLEPGRAMIGTAAFLSCYLARHPAVTPHVGCYWAALALSNLLRIRRHARSSVELECMEQFHMNEIQAALEFNQ